jgi:hypothetical protein
MAFSRLIRTLEGRLGAVSLTVYDDGGGIFEKIKSSFGLEDYRHAILEMATIN